MSRWAINEDAESELRYWMAQLIWALKQGLLFALLAGLAIALAPPNTPQALFARDFWTYLVEVAFWFGMLLAMLWSGVRRAGAFFTGVLPWEDKPAAGRRTYER